MRHIGHWIDGKELAGGSHRRGPVYAPASGRQEAEVDLAWPGSSSAAVDPTIPSIAASSS